jgi:hypothetical protein
LISVSFFKILLKHYRNAPIAFVLEGYDLDQLYHDLPYNKTREVKIMPGFGTPFSGLAEERKLTEQELIRAIRFMIAAEYEAVQLYMQLAESTDNKLAIEVLKDIADEEKVHAGEFLRLLKELALDEENFYLEGAKEVEEEIEKMRKK